MNNEQMGLASEERIDLVDVSDPGGPAEMKTEITAWRIQETEGYVAEVRIDIDGELAVHTSLTSAHCLSLGQLLLRAAERGKKAAD